MVFKCIQNNVYKNHYYCMIIQTNNLTANTKHGYCISLPKKKHDISNVK